MTLRGRVHKYGANVDTDVIIPARYLSLNTPEELAPHCMEDIDAEFVQRVRSGDVIVADTNFGCGSSREHAPLALKGAGVSCVIAKSFARIFYRNAINVGLPILECPEAVDGSEAGDELAVELETGTIRNLSKGREFKAKPYPQFMLELIQAGGLVEHTKRRLAGERR
jgi:3-isopropylmalate/(R)-2-methylmalate dehydratase small subunit